MNKLKHVQCTVHISVFKPKMTSLLLTIRGTKIFEETMRTNLELIWSLKLHSSIPHQTFAEYIFIGN